MPRLAALDLLLATVVISISLWWLRLAHVANQRGRCAAITPGGVFVRTARFEGLIAYERIAALTQYSRSVRIWVKGSSDPVVFEDVFADDAEASEFRGAVEDTLRSVGGET